MGIDLDHRRFSDNVGYIYYYWQEEEKEKKDADSRKRSAAKFVWSCSESVILSMWIIADIEPQRRKKNLKKSQNPGDIWGLICTY